MKTPISVVLLALFSLLLTASGFAQEGPAQQPPEEEEFQNASENAKPVKKALQKPKKQRILHYTVHRRKKAKPKAVDPQPAPKRQTRFTLTPVIGCSHFTLSGDLIKNSFANSATDGPGYLAGVLTEYRKNKGLLGVETGLLYVQSGAVGTDGVFSSTQGQLDHIYNESLYLPVTGKLYLLRKNRFEFLFKAGIMFGTLLSSEIGVTTTTNVKLKQDSKDLFKSTDWLWNAGLGAKFTLATDFSAGLEIAYHRGFQSISSTATLAGIAGGQSAGSSNTAYNEGVIGFIGLFLDL